MFLYNLDSCRHTPALDMMVRISLYYPCGTALPPRVEKSNMLEVREAACGFMWDGSLWHEVGYIGSRSHSGSLDHDVRSYIDLESYLENRKM
jgi:hypothetical protein